MSSSRYSTVLDPEPQLRRLVLLAGYMAALLGVVTVLSIAAAGNARLLASAVWLAISARELLAVTRGYRRCRRIRIHCDGVAEIWTPDERWEPVTLRRGSVVLGAFAWLRLETADGCRHAELLSGDARENQQWRRLRVIWRHLGTAR